jgi:simple sugar transport system permease protein
VTSAPVVGVPAGAPSAFPDPQRASRLVRIIRRPEFGSLVGCAVVYVFFAVVAGGHHFVSVQATAGWLNITAELGIIAAALSLLMIAGEIDLSFGAVIGAAQVIVALGAGFYNASTWAMIALALVFGALVGVVNGLVTVKTGLPSFIVTLGTWFVVAGLGLGLSLQLTGTSTLTLTFVPRSAHDLFASTVNGFHISIAWWVAITVLASVVLLRTRFGNWTLATGGDPSAARAAGVPTGRVKVSLFILTATAAALVGIIQTLEYNTGNVTSGADYVFNAIVAVIVGGVLLTGGYGSPLGVAIGAVIYGIVSVGVYYTGWNTNYVQAFLGALLLLAVLANNYFRRLALTVR